MEKNILIIEDDEFFRELISKKLLSKGFKISEAVDGKTGLVRVKKSKPDLILLDILLPDVDGFEVLADLKHDSGTLSIPVVILSNLLSKEDVDKGLKLGASNFLVKSQVDSEEIIKIIEKALSPA